MVKKKKQVARKNETSGTVDWRTKVNQVLPFLMVFEAIYLFLQHYGKIFPADISVALGFVPFVHVLYSLLYLPSTVAILTFFSISEFAGIEGSGRLLLTSAVGFFTSPLLLSLWGLFMGFLIYKRRRIAWHLMRIGAIITLYDIYTGIPVYSYLGLVVSAISAVLLILFRKFYR